MSALLACWLLNPCFQIQGEGAPPSLAAVPNPKHGCSLIGFRINRLVDNPAVLRTKTQLWPPS